MRCWVGGEEAEGMCRFGGRAVCKKDARTRPFLFETWQDAERLRALAVEDTLWRGVCQSRAAQCVGDCVGSEPRVCVGCENL